MGESERMAAEAERVARRVEALKAQGKEYRGRLEYAKALARGALAEIELERRREQEAE